MRTFLIGILIFCAAGWSAAQQDEQRFTEVYSIGFGDPQAAEEAAKAIVGEGGTVVLDKANLRLIVAATKAEHAMVSQLLSRLNVPPRNVRIDVKFLGHGTQRDTGAGIEVGGGVVITESGTRSRLVLKPQIHHEVTETSSDVVQSLLVASGREGRLEVGEQVPYLEWITDYGLRWGVLHERINWQRVGSRLVVEPTVIGDGPLVRVRLTPELSGLVEGNPYHVRFAQAATEVVVSDGQSIQIGGLDKDEDFYSHFLIGFERSSGQSSLDIVLTPHIEGGTAP